MAESDPTPFRLVDPVRDYKFARYATVAECRRLCRSPMSESRFDNYGGLFFPLHYGHDEDGVRSFLAGIDRDREADETTVRDRTTMVDSDPAPVRPAVGRTPLLF
jgi:hypothetical protein